MDKMVLLVIKLEPFNRLYSMSFAFVRLGIIFVRFRIYSTISCTQQDSFKRLGYNNLRRGKGFSRVVLYHYSEFFLSTMSKTAWAPLEENDCNNENRIHRDSGEFRLSGR